MTETGLIRSILLLFPTTIWIGLYISNQFSTRLHASAFLAYVWQFQTTTLLSIMFIKLDMWKFNTNELLFYSVPIDIIIGQAVLFGAVNFLIFNKLSSWMQITIISLLMFSLYALSPLLTTESQIYLPVILITLLSIIPSIFLAQWTAKESHLYLRSILQSFCWICGLFWLIPAIIFENSGDSWMFLFERKLLLNSLYFIPLILPILILFSALYQFAIEGNGTAFPYDPPKVLVTKGVYAYISNPMQVGICMAVAWWGVILNSYYVMISSLVAVMLFIVFKDICNGSSDIGERDPTWKIYKSQVPKWLPRLTAWKYPNI